MLLSDELCQQGSKSQEICHPETRAALTYDDLWIGRDEVRPLPRHRTNALGFDAQQESRAVSVVTLADADELLSAERVERVCHAHKALRYVGRTCILY